MLGKERKFIRLLQLINDHKHVIMCFQNIERADKESYLPQKKEKSVTFIAIVHIPKINRWPQQNVKCGQFACDYLRFFKTKNTKLSNYSPQ